jgi:hypothetical protein
MVQGLHSIGVEPMRSPTVPEQQQDGVRATAEAAGLSEIAVMEIEATQSFADFDHYWEEQTLTVSPVGRGVAQLDEAQRARLRETMRSIVPTARDGSISYPVRAVAFRARA